MKLTQLATLISLTTLGATPSFAQDYTNQIVSKRPNIVVIMAEDLSPRFGAYGDKVANTPNIDAFADQAVRFDNAYAMAPISAPSRAGVITGRFPNSIGLQHMRTVQFKEKPYVGVPPEHIKAYPEILRRNNYFTYNDTKTDYQFTNGLADPGPFTIWDQQGKYSDLTDQNIPFPWREFDLQGKNFYLRYNPQITHESSVYFADTAHQSMQSYIEKWDELRQLYQIERTNVKDVTVPDFLPDTPEVRRDIARHYDNIQILDRQIGKLFAALKKDNLWDNTIVIITSDHGDGLPRHKRTLYDTGLQVPFIAYVPEQYQPSGWKQPGQADQRLVSFEDLAPTLLGFAGAEIPDYMHGNDLSADDSTPRQYAYSVRDRMGAVVYRGRTVRDERFRYIRNYNQAPEDFDSLFSLSQGAVQSLLEGRDDQTLTREQAQIFAAKPEEELYDTVSDPQQLHNLADNPAYQDELERFRLALAEWQSHYADLSLIPEEKLAQAANNQHNQQSTTQAPYANFDSLTNRFSISNITSGASIGYQLDNGDWQLYTGTFEVPPGTRHITYKAVRYGWKESEAQRYQITKDTNTHREDS
ncbi:sulfatase [Vibrio sp. RE88]|uniref:sulfatase family protein n=1 Tax=Vibrio sp. RE88 TaxID=2607610 RepID=UPI001493DCA6|nr:sulfatase [Vibrio sp. RE88]NOH62334.1 sulfatase [Vibrio sp. RE88]